MGYDLLDQSVGRAWHRLIRDACTSAVVLQRLPPRRARLGAREGAQNSFPSAVWGSVLQGWHLASANATSTSTSAQPGQLRLEPPSFLLHKGGHLPRDVTWPDDGPNFHSRDVPSVPVSLTQTLKVYSVQLAPDRRQPALCHTETAWGYNTGCKATSKHCD
jgi:hypothetical protein